MTPADRAAREAEVERWARLFEAEADRAHEERAAFASEGCQRPADMRGDDWTE